MKNLMLRGIVVGPVMTNCYFLKNKATEEILIVDPAAEAERICRTLDRIGGKPAGILLTHGHYDHIMAVNELKENLGLPVYAAREEKAMLNDASSNLSLSWEGKGYTVYADHYLEEEEVLMSGDTIFAGNCGRCDLPGGNFAKMQQSLHKIIDHLPEQVQIYPGHGEETTIRHERSYNPYL